MFLQSVAVALLSAGVVLADSLSSINHVILFMQENRAFDHYYGTMAGVRGFQDPTELSQGKSSTYYQPLSNPSNGSFLLPWYVASDPAFVNASQCMFGGSNDWTPNHQGWNNGEWNQWVIDNTPYTWGHFTRNEIPSHFAIAEAFTIGDMYMQSVIGPTNPNRVTWVSGSINVPGGNINASEGGVYIENWATPGCESPGVNCWPLQWKTTPEYLEDAGISWFVYQNLDNFGDNPFAMFDQYLNAPVGSPLAANAFSFQGIQKFYDDLKDGSLPEVSYIVGPMEICEHPPWMPKDGAWFTEQIVNAVVNSPIYKETALIISYDESGGWGDHVIPYISGNGTAGEWLFDPENITHFVPSGPGPRVPLTIVSPWTTGGKTFTEPSDHTSQIMFLEEWQASKGKNITSLELSPWRRQYMSNLVNAFDFQNPNYTAFTIDVAETPVTNFAGNYMGTIDCLVEFGEAEPPVPYGNQTAPTALWVETGFRQLRGSPTEGRFNVFVDQKTGKALTLNTGNQTLGTAEPSENFQDMNQGFWLAEDQALFINGFTILPATNYSICWSTPTQPTWATEQQLNEPNQDVLFTGAYTVPLLLCTQGSTFSVLFNAENGGYAIQAFGSESYVTPSATTTPQAFIAVADNGAVTWSTTPSYFNIYAVTYPSTSVIYG